MNSNQSEQSFIDPNSFTEGDAQNRFIHQRLRLDPWIGTLGFLVLVSLPVLVNVTLVGIWQDRDGLLGLANDYGWWCLRLTSFAATVFSFIRAPIGVHNVLEGLRKNQVILIPDESAAPNDSFKVRAGV